MFKVSFKDTPKNPSKFIQKVGRVTTVHLRGTAKLPAFWKYLPAEISKWIGKQNHVEVYEQIVDNKMIIFSKGVAKCNPEDKFDTVLGERIAESRAKFYIYNFFYELTKRISLYYGGIVYGKDVVVNNAESGGLLADVEKYETLSAREVRHEKELLNNHKDGQQSEQQPV